MTRATLDRGQAFFQRSHSEFVRSPLVFPRVSPRNDKFFDVPSTTLLQREREKEKEGKGEHFRMDFQLLVSARVPCGVLLLRRKIELSRAVTAGSFTLDGARDGPEWEIIVKRIVIEYREEFHAYRSRTESDHYSTSLFQGNKRFPGLVETRCL